MNTLTFNHVAAANQLTEQARELLAAPIITALRDAPAVGEERDPAGIPRRPGWLLEEALQGVSLDPLAVASARSILFRAGADQRVIAMLESVALHQPDCTRAVTAQRDRDTVPA